MVAWSGQDAGKGAASGAAAGSAFGPYGTAIGAGVGLVAGGMMGGQSRQEEERKRKLAEEARRQALAAFQNINMPQYNAVNFGTMDKDYNTNSEFQNISTDPEMRNKQINALGSLDQVIKGGGLTAQDKANWSQYQMQANEADKGRRDAIMQQQQMRGMASGGNTLLAQLQSSQATTNQQSQAGQNLAGIAQQRALDAMMQSGQMAGNIRGQDWGEKSQRAAALDAMSRFNTSNTMDQDRFNVGQNDKTQLYLNEIKKMSFDDQMRMASQIAAQYGMEADFNEKMRQASAQERGEMMKALFEMGASAYSAYGDREQQKKDDYVFSQQYPNYKG